MFYFLSAHCVSYFSGKSLQFIHTTQNMATLKKHFFLLFHFVCAGTNRQGPMAGSQEAQAEQNSNGGFLGKIKKALFRGLESL